MLAFQAESNKSQKGVRFLRDAVGLTLAACLSWKSPGSFGNFSLPRPVRRAGHTLWKHLIEWPGRALVVAHKRLLRLKRFLPPAHVNQRHQYIRSCRAHVVAHNRAL